MRKIFLFLLTSCIALPVFSQTTFENLSFTPQLPKPGDQLSFEFNAALSSLKAEKNVDIAIYLFNSDGLKVLEPATTIKGGVYSGSITLDSNTQCIAFGFSAADQKDNNSGKGYAVPVFNSSNKPLLESYVFMGQLYAGFGAYLFGMPTEPEKYLATLEEAFKVYPDAKTNESFANAYFGALAAVKKKEAEPLILDQLKQFENKKMLKESEYGLLSAWYGRFKMKAKADSFAALMKVKYPEGAWKKEAAKKTVMAEKDGSKKENLLAAYIASYPVASGDIAFVKNIKSQIASGYAEAKNFTAFNKLAAEFDPELKYSIYNNLAWNMAEANENIAEATRMAKEGTEWAKIQLSSPTVKKPDNLTKKDWAKKLESDYAMYADTYAFILYNTGAYNEGLPYAKDAATINKLQDAELNERYALLLAKAAPAKEAQKVIEQMTSDGKATEKTKAALKELYIKENNGAAGYEMYLANLEKASKDRRIAEIEKSMLNETAPNFKLKDFDGKEVSLESLKGKVVVVDFWATWCGPCIASMPGMKMAEEQLKPRGDVVFLFVDTWENVEDKKKNAMDFMKKKNYPFYVLMDNDNKVVGDFKVEGIPTKFIIDKKGAIRFKATGFSGNADELVEELTVMVDLASK